jgi:hypothetical protein
MKFILMINVPYGTGDYQQHQLFTKDAWQAHLQFMQDLNQALKRSGEFVEVNALQPPGRARVVRQEGGRAPIISDGPFAETKEFLAGFWIVEVAGPERALEIAAKASSAPGPDGKPMGMPIEVREVMGSGGA